MYGDAPSAPALHAGEVFRAAGAREVLELGAGFVGYLDKHPRVARVNYPGLAAGRAAQTVAAQMRGHGGMLSFVVDGDATAAVADRLRIFTIAPSLGGVESLVTQPITTHHGLAAEKRARRGGVDGLVRVSVGLEDAEDLIADLEQALA